VDSHDGHHPYLAQRWQAAGQPPIPGAADAGPGRDACGRVAPVAVRQEDVAGASGLRGMIKGASSPR